MKQRLLTLSLALAIGVSPSPALDGPTPVRTLGPTGIEVEPQADGTLLITRIADDSPADGQLRKGLMIRSINGQTIPTEFWEQRIRLGDLITDAEARNGVLQFATDQGTTSIKIPNLGNYSPTWPERCRKTSHIISTHAAWLRQQAQTGKGFSDHSMTNGLAILSLLSTGNEEDLSVVRQTYQKKMAGFSPDQIGPHSWHNGYQGIAACEYFLRTGDKSVMPLINAIASAAKRYQVHGGYYHWATAANPKYGVVNATGTNMLTFLLLAKHCGAEVDEKTLLDSLTFFYRFIGHGNNAYGDGRPESGQGGNGKTEQISAAMRVAALSENGSNYQLAADKAAQSSLYNYRAMLNGHTGPIGGIWYQAMASALAEKQPALFRNRQNQVRWFFELSRLHDGSFVMSSSRGYDNTEYGRSILMGLAAHRKNLRITGAPRSPHGVSFRLPDLPWGRPADLAFFSLHGSPGYQALDPVPHLEYQKISTATADQLRRCAGHPEQAFREAVAAAIRQGEHYTLIEDLLASHHPFERHTACLAINQLEQWQLRMSKGWLSAKSIDPKNFTQRMFDRLVAMVRNPNEAIWLVDQSLIALAAASPKQIAGVMDSILPWLEHEEWWFLESATIALSPTLSEYASANRSLPAIAKAYGTCDHVRGRNTVQYLMSLNAPSMPAEVRKLASALFLESYEHTPTQVSQPDGMDLSAITSVSLAGTIETILSIDPAQAPAMAELAVSRLDEIQERERNLHIEALIKAAHTLEPGPRKAVGDVLSRHFRRTIYRQNAELLSPAYQGPLSKVITPLNTILQIDQLAGSPLGWKLLDPSQRSSTWMVTSFDPPETLKPEEHSRFRPITLPQQLEKWYLPDFQTDGSWTRVSHPPIPSAPQEYRGEPYWKSHPEQQGEVILLRKTIEVADLNQALYRLVIYSRQGYRIYINGELVAENKSRSKNWWPRMEYGNPSGVIRAALKPGTNVIAATSFLQYFKGKEGDLEVDLEALKQWPLAN